MPVTGISEVRPVSITTSSGREEPASRGYANPIAVEGRAVHESQETISTIVKRGVFRHIKRICP
jgi:hypothetical protein